MQKKEMQKLCERNRNCVPDDAKTIAMKRTTIAREHKMIARKRNSSVVRGRRN